MDAIVLTTAFGGGGHPRAAGATVMLPLGPARDAVLAEATRLIDGLAPADGRSEHRRGTPRASSSWTSPSGRLRMTWWPSCGACPAYVASVTAAPSTRSRRACCRCSWAAATRMVEYHLGDEKAYRAVMVFGARSTTDDLDGELTPVGGPPPSRDAVEAALGALVGVIEQTPPIYSAVRIGGRHAYDLARHGEVPALKSRTVTIHAIDVVDWDVADPERPAATVELRCSAGTYVRALARDAGEPLGTGAYLGRPRADRERSLPPGRIPPARRGARATVIRSRRGAAAATRFGARGVSGGAGRRDHADQAWRAARSCGCRRTRCSEPGPSGLVRVLSADGRLAAMARLDTGRLHPEKVFLDPPAPAVTSRPPEHGPAAG